MLDRFPRSIKFAILLISYISILGSSVLMLWFYHTKWSLHLNTKDVVVTVREIAPNSVITAQDVTVKPMRLEYVVNNTLSNPNDVVGKHAVSYLDSGEQITTHKVEEISISPSRENEYIFPIPEGWVMIMPDTIRRKDKISLWANGIPVEVPKGSKKSEPVHKAYIESAIRTGTPILSDVRIAYLRNGGNGEVLTPPDMMGKISADRLQSNSSPKTLQLLLTEEEFQLLSDTVELGYKLVVGYK